MKAFYRGIIVLVMAAFISEIFEFLVNVVLARELGEMGMGLYMSILPSIFLVVIIASLELPVSVSKFIAEKEAQYHKSMLTHTFQLTILFTIVLMSAVTIIFILVPVFQTYHPYIRWACILLIPIISFSSIARGYFMGLQKMSKIAISNLMRKIAQLLLLIIVFKLFQFQIESAILIAICVFIGSELIVFLYLIHAYYLQARNLKEKRGLSLRRKEVRDKLLAVSLPTTGMRIFHALTHAVKPFLIKSALLKAGLTATAATEQFGMVAGVALTIGFFPAFIAHSLLIMLIPTVSEAYAKKDLFKLQKLLQQVMMLTFLYGVPAVFIFNIFAEPLTNLFFKSSTASIYLQLLWPYFLVHFFVIPMQAFLIGLGLVKEAFLHSIWSTIISFSLIYIFGSSAQFGMYGVIIGMNTGGLLLLLMHYLTICKKINFSLILRRPVKHYD
ncbi:polysaccharide biosynthesis protein [Bacillus aquiflavi]|uniref:Polysaccharide biosynthesis protein n=1 Tax=Bacillus aquiflavi TaxID=2672567 RepID=A0A6B3VXT6_9BACI|nr:polysaccharide biosynthesis protein [Bacillus aquiflavi]MBA4536718.1 polysaccharide biosynthesis protein [Bacillus aquiflavi]NEY81085.1 polysaccharide biosynthesis protein [Bacillus aquiflavi]UAC48751.1 polysaccharide biosynthesis protein [Bacillus aquiflavi]